MVLQHSDSDPLPSIVLLVSLEHETRAAYSASCESAGLWVATATNYVEAMAAVQELRPDLVIVHALEDASSAGVLIAEMRESADASGIPIILLSRTSLQAVPLSIRQRADLCLEEPLLPAVLVQSSRELIARAREHRSTADTAPARRPEVATKPIRPLPGKSAVHPGNHRRCPACAGALEWIERTRLFGIQYDYYRWCPKGCGLYCYNLDGHAWVKLA